MKEAKTSESITRLLDINLELSIYMFWLCSEESKANKTYLEAYALRKTEEASKSITTDGNSQAERDKRAIVETKEFKDTEIKAEVLYNALRLHRMGLENFIGVVTQKISFLKKEAETSKGQV